MSDPSSPMAPASRGRLPVGRLLLFGLVLLVGLGLFIALARRTPTMATPVGFEQLP